MAKCGAESRDVMMIPNNISIQGISGGTAEFILIFNQEEDLKDLKHPSAHFVKDGNSGEMHVELVEINPHNLMGVFPSSLTPGKFRVRVTSSDGSFLGIAFFSCWDNTSKTLEQLKRNRNLQSIFLQYCIQNIGVLPVPYDVAAPEDAESGYDGDNEASSSDSADDRN